MKKLFFLLLICAACVACTGNSQKPKSDTPCPQKVDFGSTDFYPAFDSKHFHKRDITVWLPKGYSDKQKYAVVYMHDGQMLFDKNTSWNKQSWNVDSVAQAVQNDGRTRPFIVVGIDNHPEGRLYEYMPRKALDYIPNTDTLLARYDKNMFIADKYLCFIVEELKPFIDSTYSTHTDRESTFIMGSSMGGLISMYAVCEYPHVFGGAGCLSTHTPLVITNAPEEAPVWAKAFHDYLNDHLPATNQSRIYMDCGDRTLDFGYLPFQHNINRLFKQKGWGAAHYLYRIYPGHAHDENSWESRLNVPFEYLIRK